MPLNGPPERRRLTPATRRVWQILREVRGQARSHSQASFHGRRCASTAPPATAFRPRQKHARQRATSILRVGASPAREPAVETFAGTSAGKMGSPRSVQRHKRPAPIEPGDRGSRRNEGTQDECGSAAERTGDWPVPGRICKQKSRKIHTEGSRAGLAPTVRTGASPWAAAPPGCPSRCRAAHPQSGRCSATDNRFQTGRTPATPAPSAALPVADSSARHCG